MSSFRSRPRFKMVVPISTKELEARLTDKLKDKSIDCECVFLDGHCVIKIPYGERHFWSPELSLSIEEDKDGSLIRGLYGPNSTIWTMFMFGYIGIGTLAFFTSFYGFSRLSLGMEAQILWLLPVLVACALMIYLFAQVGQKLGAEQMYRLHHFFEATIGRKPEIY